MKEGVTVLDNQCASSIKNMKGDMINRDVTNKLHPPIFSIQHTFIYMKERYGQSIQYIVF